MNKYVNSEKGVGSLMAVLSLAVLMVIVGGIATMTIANSYENRNNKDNMQIQYAAEAGLKKALVSFDNNEDGQSFKWLPDNDTLDDNGVIIKEESSSDGKAVKTNLHKYKDKDAKASYAVYICKEDSENPGKLVKVNDDLKNGVKPVKGTTYYITAYGFINSGNDKKKIASAKYVYNGGGNNSGGNDSSNGGIALYSDDSGNTAIDGLRTNKFNLIHGTKIAARGEIPPVVKKGSDNDNDQFLKYNVVVHFDGDHIKNMEKAREQVLVETPLTSPYPKNYPEEYKYDIDFNYPILSYTKKAKNDTTLNFDNLKKKIINEGTSDTFENYKKNNPSIENKIIEGKILDKKSITIKDSYITADLIQAEDEIRISNSIINANISKAKKVIIEDSYVVADSFASDGSGYCDISNSNIVVKGDFTSGTGGLLTTIDNSNIEINGKTTLGPSKITNVTMNIKGDLEVKGSPNFTVNNTNLSVGNDLTIESISFDKSIIEDVGTMTIKQKITGINGILNIGKKLEVSSSCDFDNVFIQFNNDKLEIHCPSTLKNSFIYGKNVDIQSSPNGFTNSLILAKNSVNIQGNAPIKIYSLIKTYEGNVSFPNKVDLKGIILAKGKFSFSGWGHEFTYDDTSRTHSLDLSDLIEADSNILKPFGYFVERLKEQEEVADSITYGQYDYAGTQKINND